MSSGLAADGLTLLAEGFMTSQSTGRQEREGMAQRLNNGGPGGKYQANLVNFGPASKRRCTPTDPGTVGGAAAPRAQVGNRPRVVEKPSVPKHVVYTGIDVNPKATGTLGSLAKPVKDALLRRKNRASPVATKKLAKARGDANRRLAMKRESGPGKATRAWSAKPTAGARAAKGKGGRRSTSRQKGRGGGKTSEEEKIQRRIQHNAAERNRTRIITQKINRMRELLHEAGRMVKDEKLPVITEGLTYLKDLTAAAQRRRGGADGAGGAALPTQTTPNRSSGSRELGIGPMVIRGFKGHVPVSSIADGSPFAIVDATLKVVYSSQRMAQGLRALTARHQLDRTSVFSFLYGSTPVQASTKKVWNDIQQAMKSGAEDFRALVVDAIVVQATRMVHWFRIDVSSLPLANGDTGFIMALLPQVGPPAAAPTVGGKGEAYVHFLSQSDIRWRLQSAMTDAIAASSGRAVDQ